MDIIGQPDSKRPRIGSGSAGSWSSSSPHPRSLLHPPPGHGQSAPSFNRPPIPYSRPDTQPHTPHTPQSIHSLPPHPAPHQTLPPSLHHLDDRRHHEQPDHAVQHQDPHRPPSSPPHSFPPPYAGPRDPPMKRDSSDEGVYQQQQQQHHHRPPSTGNGIEHNTTLHPEEQRRHGMYGTYEPQVGQGHPGPYRLSTTSTQYPLPPSSMPQSPMVGPSQTYESMQGYSAGSGPIRDPYQSVQPQYAQSSANLAKRKPQRAAQACDSCRNLKAKCDEMKPCTTCREKNLVCNFRTVNVKPQDKSQEQLLEAITSMASNFSRFAQQQEERQEKLERQWETQQREWHAMYEWLKGNAFHENQTSNGAADIMKKEEFTDGKGPQAVSSMLQRLQSQATQVESSPRLQSPPAVEQMGVQVDFSEEEDQGDPKPPGPPAMPVNHTTGAARLLLVGPIAAMIRDMKNVKVPSKIETFPMQQETKRGLLRLFGRGEGLDLSRGYDSDQQGDNSDATPSDMHSDASSPGYEDWGHVGLTPNTRNEFSRGELSLNGMPDFRKETVIELMDSYMNKMNVLHPLVTEAGKNSLVASFLKSLTRAQPKPRQIANLSQHGRTPDSPGLKRRKISRDGSSEHLESASYNQESFNPGRPPRSISTAMVLAMLALGAICKHKEKIRDVSGTEESQPWRSSPKLRNGYTQSSVQGSPTMSVQSPEYPSSHEADRIHPHSRRTSMDGSAVHPGYSSRTTNLDVIPGLQYFAMATDIIGNQLAGSSLQHVHVNILLSLYHGQLGRVIESQGFLANACRGLLVAIHSRLARWEKMMAKEPQVREPVPPKDNPLLFAFWTCLQLESDILAELPLEQTGILKYESKIPWPSLLQAEQDGHDAFVLQGYFAQLFLRKHLNQLHTMFYAPDPDLNGIVKPPPVATNIDIMARTLEDWRRSVPDRFKWNDGDPPADNIIVARLRGKYYGACVITYRYFVLKILENSAAQASSSQDPGQKISLEFVAGIQVPSINTNATSMEQISPEVLRYARCCIDALKASTIAFDGVVEDIGTERLIVTNVWGTAHAQWGNVMTLQAVYRNKVLQGLIEKEELQKLLQRTLRFLSMVAQPSSALYTDIQILNHAAERNGLIPKKRSNDLFVASSFGSSNGGGDATMSGGF